MLTRPGTGNSSNPLKIRAHHLLCIQGFQGHGYSREFEENMWNIIENIDNVSSIYLKIISKCDDICYKCPHNQDESCTESTESNNRIVKMDEAVLKKIGINEGFIEKSSVIFEKVNSVFKNINNLQEVCSNCSWHAQCLYYQKISSKKFKIRK